MNKARSVSMLEIRHRVTNVLITINLGIAATYAVTPPSRTQSQARVVAYVEGLGPVWICLFVVAGLYLLAARIAKRGLIGAHAFALGVSVFYSGALWWSVILGSPFAFSVVAWASLSMAAAHYALSRWYASGGAS